MAATTTMQRVENKLRREYLKDIYPDAYRWNAKTALSLMYDAIEDLCSEEPAAKFDQDTGELLSAYNVPDALALVDLDDDSTELSEAVTAVRATTIPVDDRWMKAIILFTASRCFKIDDSDTANEQKAALLFEEGRREALS